MSKFNTILEKITDKGMSDAEFEKLKTKLKNISVEFEKLKYDYFKQTGKRYQA